MLYSHTLLHAAKYYPNLPAISGQHPATFREFVARVDRVAAELHERGFRPGDRLALHLLNGVEFLELVYACSRLGVISVPINTRYSMPEIDAVLEDCSPKGLIRHQALPQPRVRVAWEHVVEDQPLSGSDSALPPVFYDPDAVYGLFYTSGTTGKAKGVMLTHRSLYANLQNCLPYFRFRPGHCYLHAAPMFHLADFPSVLSCMSQGVCQAIIPRFDLREFCERVQQDRVTTTVLIPTMINFLTLYGELESYDLSSLEVVLYGGSPMAPEVLKRARHKLPGVKFIQAYGMTESSCLLTLLEHDDHEGERLLSCGRPPFGVELAISDPEGKFLPVGEAGEVVARGMNLMKGYWNQPEETARTLEGGWLHTGDIGKQDADGFFYIVDRKKDMIITGGENVYSSEVEAVVYSHPAIKEAAVIGVPDQRWGELVTACVVVKAGASLTADELIAFCRTRLANYKLPRKVEIVDGELPKSGTGKILKRALREPYWANYRRGVS
jgi:long-chain acyl-CoA synthetase